LLPRRALVAAGMAMERARESGAPGLLAQERQGMGAPPLRSVDPARRRSAGRARQLVRGERVLRVGGAAAAHRSGVGSGGRNSALSVGRRKPTRSRASGWTSRTMRLGVVVPVRRWAEWIAPDDRQRLGVDRERFPAVPGVLAGSLQGLLAALVRSGTQSAARRMLGHALAHDPQR